MRNIVLPLAGVLAVLATTPDGYAQSKKDPSRTSRDASRASLLAPAKINDRTSESKKNPIRKGETPTDTPTKTAAELASKLLDGTVAAGDNDFCVNQESIAGEATFSFDNRRAEMDGPDHAACDFAGETQIARDVWFCWTAPAEACSGDFVASTCGGLIDTKIAVYEGCACPPTDANLLTCNDDDCGLQTQAPFNPVPEQQYLIRVGTFPSANPIGGLGTLRLQCIPPQPCNNPGGDCQARAVDGILVSNGTDASVAEDFTPAQTGQVTSACWWGAYVDVNGDSCQSFAVDAFEMNYYRGSAGTPGDLLASFSQTEGTLTLSGPVATGLTLRGGLPEFAFSATHAPVPVLAGECYWIEITNPILACAWLWEESILANGRVFQDGALGSTPGFDPRDGLVRDVAFCLDIPLGDSIACLPPPPDNDDCVNASSISTEGQFFYEIAGATRDGPDEPACLASGQSQIDHDEWICWTAPCDGEIFVRTCGETDVDTKLAVYDGCDCPPAIDALLECNDDLCGSGPVQQSMLTFNAVKGNSYLLRVGTFPGSPGGPGLLDIRVGAPDNIACPSAGSCCTGAGSGPAQQGCASESCCEKVCACDPFCCEFLWDELCAGQGVSGCGAANLCECGGTCGSAEAGSCCEGTGTPACSDATCCELVCDCDPFCCNTEWDDLCAGEGSEPGCGAALLCNNLCETVCPEGDVDWVSPDPSVVDARRPHDRNDATLTEGVDTILLTAPPGAGTACFSLDETAADGDPNFIAQIVEDAGTYTLTLARPITKGAVTTIIYADIDTISPEAEYVSHPGNVNDDGMTDSTDVRDFVAALAGDLTLPWGIFSEDIDRSGALSPLDLLELVDLLNGSEAFDRWNNTAKTSSCR